MLKVRVKNFQSLVDSEILIDGFTTLTGKNNTGKSAFIRAIYAVFTNPTYAPIANDLNLPVEVELTGDDFHLKWIKGKGFNSYIINGKTFDKVGTDLPDELMKIGIHDIDINGKKIYPQFAMQLTGQIFLTNLSGAYLSEAVADTNSVQLLTNAYKLSEKYKKNAVAELKIRNKDLVEVKKTLQGYSNFPLIKQEFTDLQQKKKDIDLLSSRIKEVSDLRDLIETARSTQQKLKDIDLLKREFDNLIFSKCLDQLAIIQETRDLEAKLIKTRSVINNLKDFDILSEKSNIDDMVQELSRIKNIFNRIWEVVGIFQKISYQQGVIKNLDLENLETIDVQEINSLKKTYLLLTNLVELREQRKLLGNSIYQASIEIENKNTQLIEIKDKITQVLKENGKCPVCSV